METIYLFLSAQVGVGTFFMKSPLVRYKCISISENPETKIPDILNKWIGYRTLKRHLIVIFKLHLQFSQIHLYIVHFGIDYCLGLNLHLNKVFASHANIHSF